MAKSHSGKYYADLAEKHGLRVENGRGDHIKIYAPNERPMTVPMHRELATGTEHTIRKWFIRLGILVVLGIGAMSCYITSLGLAQGLRP